MSETAVMVVGVFVFAITVWGTVMAGGMTLSRRMDAEARPAPVTRVVDE